MSRKLLDKTLRVYVLFSLIVLFISAPLFYFLAVRLFVDDADEALFLRKREFLAYHIPYLKVAEIPVWNKFNRDVKIEDASPAGAHDAIFYRFYLDTLDNENEPYRVLRSPVIIENRPYTLMARINLVESEDMILSIALLFSAILSALLIGFYLITRRLSSKLWKPFYSTLEQVEQFELDKSASLQLTTSDIEEFTRLNHSVSRLLERNVLSYENQKEFIENAAHELQTPLAFIQAKLDTLVQQLTFTNELSDTLSNLNNSVARLNRINKNLLLLSKIENNQYEASEDVSLSDILIKQTTFLSEQAGERKVKVHVDAIEPWVTNANATLLEIAVGNLLLNALRHNQTDGHITVTLDRNTLRVSNTGRSALDRENLFRRFYRHGSDGGTGLGLAIVKKISDLQGWKLDYSYEGEMHIFQVVF